MDPLTTAELVTLIAALVNASPKLIQILQELHDKGASPAALLSPDQHARVLEAMGTLATSMPRETGDAMVAAMASTG
jgi:hypothetical protein